VCGNCLGPRDSAASGFTCFFGSKRFVTDAELAVALADFADCSVYRCVQPHFIANPVIVGVPDPLPRRWGLLPGGDL